MIRSAARAVLSTFPPLLTAAKAGREQVRLLRWRKARPAYPPDPVLRLHLGCGDINYPGFVNIDARPAAHVHHVQRIDRLPQFADNSASLIYVSHCLEHVPHRQVAPVLTEWFRVLAPRGVVRVSVPDFDQLVDIYLDNDRDMPSVLQPLMGGQDYAFNFHYTAFNAADLSRQFVDVGFVAPRRWQFGSEMYMSLPDWSGRSISYNGKSYPVSLNLEASKPPLTE